MRLPPSLSERYQELRVLGQGAMGAVFLARDRNLGREVAVKLMLEVSGEQAQERFLREARTLAGIRDPHVVEVYEFGSVPEGPFLVMEYLRGVSLEAGPWADSELLEVARAASRALEAVHRAGLVHRDVKPANLMRTPEGRVVLTDFGLIHDAARTQITATGVLVGTLAYLAPEILARGATAPAQDWWALGVTLFQMAEGRRPFPQEVLLEALGGIPLPSPEYQRLLPGNPLRCLVEGLLEGVPEDRLGSSREVEAVLERPPSPEGGGGLPENPLPPVRAASRGAFLALVGVFLIGALGGVWLGRFLGPEAGAGSDGTSPETSSGAVLRAEGAKRAESGRAGGDRGRGLLAPDSLARLREQYQRLEGLYISPEGRQRRFETAPEESGWFPLLEPDPLYSADLWKHLPEVETITDWMVRGGDLDALSPEQRECLERLDDFLLGQTHVPPFLALRTTEPLTSPLVLREERRELFPAPPPRLDGWLGAALLARREALAGIARREEEWREFVASGGEGGPPLSFLPRATLRFTNFERSVALVRILDHARLEGHLWSREVCRDVRRMLFALARSLEREPEVRPWFVARSEQLVKDVDSFLPLEAFRARPEVLLGCRPSHSSQWILLGLLRGRASWHRRETFSRAEVAGNEGLEALARAQEVAGPDEPLYRRHALSQRLSLLAELERDADLVDLYRSHRGDLFPHPEVSLQERISVLRHVLDAWERGGFPWTPADLQSFEGDLRTCRAEGHGKWEETREDFQRVLASGGGAGRDAG